MTFWRHTYLVQCGPQNVCLRDVYICTFFRTISKWRILEWPAFNLRQPPIETSSFHKLVFNKSVMQPWPYKNYYLHPLTHKLLSLLYLKWKLSLTSISNMKSIIFTQFLHNNPIQPLHTWNYPINLILHGHCSIKLIANENWSVKTLSYQEIIPFKLTYNKEIKFKKLFF